MPQWRVYLVCEVQVAREIASRALRFQHEGQEYFIQRNSIDFEAFKDVLWSEYMERTHYVPFRPVFYSDCDRRCATDSKSATRILMCLPLDYGRGMMKPTR